MSKSGKKFSRSKLFKESTRLRRRSDNRQWYLYYKDADGRWREKSLKTTFESEAITRADKLVDQMKANNGKIPPEKLTLEKLYNEFRLAKEDFMKPESLKRIRSSYHMFSRWLDQSDYRIRFLKDLTPKIVRKYQKHRLKTVSRRTADNDVKNLGTLMQWGIIEGIVIKNPFDYSKKGNVEVSRGREKPKKTFKKKELKKVLKYMKTKEPLLYEIALVLSETGMRFGELQHLIPESLDWKRKVPRIIIEARDDWSPKDPREVKAIPMSPKIREILKRRSEECGSGEYLFQSKIGTKVPENHSLKRFKRYTKDAGVEPKGRRLHWHSLRNYFVKQAVLQGVSINAIMAMTGHDTHLMALHYSSPETDEVTDQASKMW